LKSGRRPKLKGQSRESAKNRIKHCWCCRILATTPKPGNGVRPAVQPVEQPTKVDLVVILKTAKSLHITIPKTALLRADRLIG